MTRGARPHRAVGSVGRSREALATPPPTIIPVAGGKGGVGKSFLTANLALALAEAGHEVVAVDLDLGVSNLHDFLGLPNENPGVGEYLAGHVEGPLSRLAVATAVPGLRFVPGDGRMPFMANVTYHQKQRLVREIPRLEARYVLLDLSAGTSFNTLDLCRIADAPLLVTTPVRASVMSLLVFVKNLLLRAIDRSVGRDPDLLDLLRRAYQQPMDAPLLTMRELASELEGRDPAAAGELRRLCRRQRPRLVYNMCDGPDDLGVTGSIDRTLDEILALRCDHVGCVLLDPEVRRTARRAEPHLLAAAGSPTAGAVRRIASRVERFWDRDEPIPDSGRKLRRRAEEASREQGPRPDPPGRRGAGATSRPVARDPGDGPPHPR